MNLPENQRRIWCCACDAYILARAIIEAGQIARSLGDMK